ncbi:MAG TPA: DUF58 domain-containing protein [Methylibium sp.]|uniref:DUF58 domain-containing protein n=1 Tax=Methylibium sp. TaxID=2067992 RepID=UPI002DB96C15|nr:DUF58 domain-containing protein [Methylibium sp.]HEU4459074.1 DUF58 domain-containing protein [Methylibium sp.]
MNGTQRAAVRRPPAVWPDTGERADPALAAPSSTARADVWPHPERRSARTALGGLLRLRLRAWWERRHPRRDTLTLTHANVYILPTRAGLVFALTLAVLLVASINYQLSLGYLLTFLLAGSAAVALHVTHRTLRGLTLHLRATPSVFAGEPVAVECVLDDAAGRARYGVGLRPRAGADAGWSWIDVPAGGQNVARLAVACERRGCFHLPSVRIETRFPLGLFRAWSDWRPASTVIVWPQPEQPAAALPPARGAGGASNARFVQGDELDGVRAYRRGDAPKRVLWKKAARALDTGADLVVRETSGSHRQELWLDWAEAPLATPRIADTEARLSRLAAWLLECERRGLDWGLRLPGFEQPPGAGDAHRRAALDALALWSA